MNTVETFPNAPISEAILDIRVKFDTVPSMDRLLAIHEDVVGEFPEKNLQGEVTAEMKVQEGEPTFDQKKKYLGYSFRSSDTLRIFQARINGCTFNQLRPYESWESFSNQGLNCWQAYTSKLTDLGIKIERIALRYVNKIKISDEVPVISKYINAKLPMPTGDQYLLKGFFSRIEVQEEHSLVDSIVTIASENPISNDGNPAIILDIDSIRSQFESDPTDSLRDLFDELRVIKNKLFFSYITDKSKEMFRK